MEASTWLQWCCFSSFLMQWRWSIAYTSAYGILSEVVTVGHWRAGGSLVGMWTFSLMLSGPISWLNGDSDHNAQWLVSSTLCWRFRRLHWKPENSSGISVIPTCHHTAGVVRTRSTTEVPCFVFLGWGAVCRCLWFALPCKWQDCRVSQLYFISFCLARMSSLRSIGRILTVTPSPHGRAMQALSWLHPLQMPRDRCVAGWVELVSQGGQVTSPEECYDWPSFHSYRLSYPQTQARNRKERNWLNWNIGF